MRHLTVRFGGHEAVSHVSLDAPLGRLTGLIGPNGAGKTTTFNACNGLQRMAAGSVSLFGHDATSWSAARRARSGLGRTFQRFELIDAATVRQNVLVGGEARAAGSSPFRQVLCRRAERAELEQATDEALDLCGLTLDADRAMGSLGTGYRRLVELARVICGGFELLLLDEPSSGLDEDETAAFGSVLRRLVDERGTGILLVEHDMSLVMSVCEYLFVLDYGQLIFDGTPEATRLSEVVRAAYLGDEISDAGRA